MRFVDEVRIEVRGGRGGDGIVAWRREKYVPRGGPAGGDGGRGGHIIFVADERLTTLLDLRYRKHLRAESGRAGGGRDCTGRAGEDLRISVPVGTMVFLERVLTRAGEGEDAEDAEDTSRSGAFERDQVELDTDDDDDAFGGDDDDAEDTGPGGAQGEQIADLTRHGQEVVVAKGGEPGHGNTHFRSSTNRAPHQCTPGGDGEAFVLRLELKLLADVGIVGFPNVGKSTFISKVSRARPKVADYPFTTLVPQLGVVRVGEERSFVVADVPGLIEGASQGKGLGHTFLRHLERTRVLLHLLAPDESPGRHPIDDLVTLEKELRSYGAMFDERPRVVALNKLDLLQDENGQALVEELRSWLRERGLALFPICAATGEGVAPLLEALWAAYLDQRSSPTAAAPDPGS